MTDLEAQIRKLSLREPSEQFDQRILTLLHGTAEQELNQSAPLSDQRQQNGQSRLRRGVYSMALSGAVAGLIIGFCLGTSVPSFWFPSAATDTGTPNQRQLAPSFSGITWPAPQSSAEQEFSHGHPMLPELPANIVDALTNRDHRGSQFVESHYEFARAAAALWERKNGEFFQVATHLSDRRFDMCRDCHRVGG